MTRIFAAFFAAGICALMMAPFAASGSASYEELLARPRPVPDRHIAYGSAPQQYGDLYLPKTAGMHPVAVLIHGGCWLGALPGSELMTPMIDPLRAKGFAVWNIDYRRLGQPGGGYPGTFQDASAAIDVLRGLTGHNHLDLAHVVLIGHSAGGHLALWVAARTRIAKSSVLYAAHPLRVRGVVSLSGIPDLAAYRANGPEACGGPATIDGLTGDHAKRYADTSPSELLPLGTRQFILSGGSDTIVPAEFAHAYAAKAKMSGDRVEDIEIPGAGHFDMIDPQAAAWPTVENAIVQAAH